MEITNPVLVLFEKHFELTVEELWRWLTDEEQADLQRNLNTVARDIVYEWPDLDDKSYHTLLQVWEFPETNKMVDRVKSDPAYQAERGLLTDGGVTFK